MKIGNVTFIQLSQSNGVTNEYSDGTVEDDLLNLVKSKDFSKRRQEVLDNNPSWAMYYHLSPVRANLVNWYPFPNKGKLLEVGAGCGAITEALLGSISDKVQIDALELSKRRAMINAHRNKSASNLQVIVGNVETLNKKNTYDIVVCVGVLEYAGRFISGDKPFETFLKSLHDTLKPGGTLLLAIENKLGLKYINGSREDHTGRFYDSLMSYPQYDGIRTFSRKELSELTQAAGFKDIHFFFPVPDYKLPRLVLGEDILNTPHAASLLTKLYPAPAPDQTRVYNGSEQLLLQSVLEADLFSETANSFLIETTKGSGD